jgi:hypothetical protein
MRFYTNPHKVYCDINLHAVVRLGLPSRSWRLGALPCPRAPDPLRYRSSTRASVASVWASQKVMSMTRYSSMAVDSST